VSQGLVLPLADFADELDLSTLTVGEDVTELLRIKKWEVPEVQGSAGTSHPNGFPFWVSKTDELRIQSVPEVLDELYGKPYYISTKMDGTSVSMGIKSGEFWVAGRNFRYIDDDKSSAWRWAHAHNLPELSQGWPDGITLQGEFCGEGIQKNPLQLKKPKWFVFNVIDPETNVKLNLSRSLEFCEENGLDFVPVEETGAEFHYKTVDELLERAKGQYSSGRLKEGIVVRSLEPMRSSVLLGDMSFKAINNDFLLKEK
jgi:RNA ligase (TIGR02306 family)